MAEPRPDASVVVVTHEHEDYVGACLDALAPDVAAGRAEVVVVDNRSADGSAAAARRRDWARVLVNERRRGFAVNCNVGMAGATGRYLLLLNPDTRAAPGALASLVTYMDAHPEVGLAGARLVYPDGTVQPSARRFPGLRSFLARRSPLRRWLRGSSWNRRHLMLDTDVAGGQVDWLLGACLMVRREALAQVGPLDEGFRLYVEDIDWGRRMHDAGWEVHYVPEATIVHHHRAVSDRRFLSRHTWYHLRAVVRYARKHFGPRLPLWSIRASRDTAWTAAQSTQRPADPPAARS